MEWWGGGGARRKGVLRVRLLHPLRLLRARTRVHARAWPAFDGLLVKAGGLWSKPAFDGYWSKCVCVRACLYVLVFARARAVRALARPGGGERAKPRNDAVFVRNK